MKKRSARSFPHNTAAKPKRWIDAQNPISQQNRFVTHLRYLRRSRVDDPEALVLARGGVRVSVEVPHDVLDQLLVCREGVDVHAGLDIPELDGHIGTHTASRFVAVCMTILIAGFRKSNRGQRVMYCWSWNNSNYGMLRKRSKVACVCGGGGIRVGFAKQPTPPHASSSWSLQVESLPNEFLR